MSRVALVTEGTRGIGAGISEALAESGHLVAAHCAVGDPSAETCGASAGIHTYAFDATREEEVRFAVHKISGDLGPIDILVNCAGSDGGNFLHEASHPHWDAVIQTNLTACFHLCRAVIEVMRVRKFGRIVNVGSIAGQIGEIRQTDYSAAKAGIVGFTKALARESAANGITVNAIAPGSIDVEMSRGVQEVVSAEIAAIIPCGRLGGIQDIVRCVMFLVADEADWITGSTLTVNGGQHML